MQSPEEIYDDLLKTDYVRATIRILLLFTLPVFCIFYFSNGIAVGMEVKDELNKTQQYSAEEATEICESHGLHIYTSNVGKSNEFSHFSCSETKQKMIMPIDYERSSTIIWQISKLK